MSIQQQLNELGVDPREIAESVAKSTVPGRSNDPVIDGLRFSPKVVEDVIDDLNNWFEVVDVRVYNDVHIGIPMRYRWTIIRWADNDMDQWLMDNGWEQLPHLNADSRTREEDELEARYRKVYRGVVVDTNFLVKFPERVFRKLKGEDLDRVRENQRREEMIEERKNTILRRRRE